MVTVFVSIRMHKVFDHYQCLIPEHFYHFAKKPRPVISQPCFPITTILTIPRALSVSVYFLYWVFSINGIIKCIAFASDSFSKQNILKLIHAENVSLNFKELNNIHFMRITHFVYSIINEYSVVSTNCFLQIVL